MSQNTIISRHTTSQGVVTWSRCVCGRLQMSMTSYDGKTLTAGGHAHCSSRISS